MVIWVKNKFYTSVLEFLQNCFHFYNGSGYNQRLIHSVLRVLRQSSIITLIIGANMQANRNRYYNVLFLLKAILLTASKLLKMANGQRLYCTTTTYLIYRHYPSDNLVISYKQYPRLSYLPMRFLGERSPK